ncbi:MAG: aminopeptidase P family N-terminal domain-containing protein [Anaerolineales bacterium]
MTETLPILQIPAEEHKARASRLAEFARRQDWTGVVLFDRDYILYYTGFAFIPTERPMAFLLDAQGKASLFVPRLEREHAASQPAVDLVEEYPEYPDRPHPMERLAALMGAMGVRGRVGADEDGYPWQFGYRGPRLSELTGATITPIRAFV